MKKGSILSAFVLGAVLGSTALSFACNAMVEREEEGPGVAPKAVVASLVEKEESNLLEDLRRTVGPDNPARYVNIHAEMKQPLLLVTGTSGEPRTAAFALKMGYNPQDAEDFEALLQEKQYEEIFKGESFANRERTKSVQVAQTLLSRCGLGRVLANMECVKDFPIQVEEETGIQAMSFSGVVQRFYPCLPGGVYPAESERLVGLLRDLTNRYGGVSFVELYNNRDLDKKDSSHILSHISFRSVEEDFVSFLLVRFGDATLRNYVLWLNSEGRVEYTNIDHEYLFATSIFQGCPLAMRLEHGNYPLSNEMVDRILGWSSDIFKDQDQHTRNIVEALQSCLRSNRNQSMYVLYFNIWKELEMSIGYSFAFTALKRNERLGSLVPWSPEDCVGMKPAPRGPIPAFKGIQ